MLRSHRARIHSQHGFSLLELLAVTLIIGLLAAIALPAFLGSTKKGHDADAKSNARNVVASVELCFAETHRYSTCDSEPELRATGARLGVALTDTTAKRKGAVSVTATEDSYTVVGYSMSSHTFAVSKAADGTVLTCAAEGSCTPGETW